MVKFAVLICVFSILTVPAFANEHEAPAASEEKKEEGGGHGGGKAEVVTPVSPWVEAENKVQELSSRIASKRSQIENLIAEKQHVDENSPQVKVIVTSLLKEHKELSGLVEDYEKNLNLLKYRFPERSAKTNRLYQKIEMQSLDEIENEMGIDGKLSRNLQRMRQHYGTQAPSKARVPSSVNQKKESQKLPEGSIENPAPIIIKK